MSTLTQGESVTRHHGCLIQGKALGSSWTNQSPSSGFFNLELEKISINPFLGTSCTKGRKSWHLNFLWYEENWSERIKVTYREKHRRDRVLVAFKFLDPAALPMVTWDFSLCLIIQVSAMRNQALIQAAHFCLLGNSYERFYDKDPFLILIIPGFLKFI